MLPISLPSSLDIGVFIDALIVCRYWNVCVNRNLSASEVNPGMAPHVPGHVQLVASDATRGVAVATVCFLRNVCARERMAKCTLNY